MVRLCVLFVIFLGLESARCAPTDATFLFFWGNTPDLNQSFALSEANGIMQHAEFQPDLKTVVYIHGYNESTTVGSAPVIVAAYQQRGDHNIIILDWAALAAGNYLLNAVINAKRLGPRLADVLIDMFDADLPLERFHLIGHSLGGQLAGIVGRNVQANSERRYQLPRISALDPAFPAFYPSLTHISASDARMVDVIHTDAWMYGAPVSTGSIDFWPNSGKSLQPGCPIRNYQFLTDNDLCSHRRSWFFWANSVENRSELTFPAVRALNWGAFTLGLIADNQVVNMGIDCQAGIHGDFYLQTNSEMPFNRGQSGTRYINGL